MTVQWGYLILAIGCGLLGFVIGSATRWFVDRKERKR